MLNLDDLASADKRELLYQAARKDPELVRCWIEKHPAHLQFYLGWEVRGFHRAAMDDALRYQEVLWLAPRGSGKSTSLAVFVPAWLAIARPENMEPEVRMRLAEKFRDAPHPIGRENIRIALVSNSAEKAVSLLWQIKAVLTDQRIRVLYGDLAGLRWQDAKADTALKTSNSRESTYTALGIGSRMTGGHYDLIVPDDMVTEDNARTELQRERLSNYWKFTVQPTLEPWGWIIGAGTRYHPADWYGEVREWVKNGTWCHLRRTPALYEVDGELRSYWPAQYSVEKLLAIKERIGSIAFATQYQNEVDQMMGTFFEKPWVENFKKWNELPEADRRKARTIVVCDPSIKAGPRNDYTAFVVLSYIAPYFYVRHVARGQWTMEETLRRAVALWKTYLPEVLGIEVVQGQEWLVQELRRRTRINVRPLVPKQYGGKDKVGRANMVRSFFEQLRVFLEEPTPTNGIGRLVEEMMAFSGENNAPGIDDTVDALIWALILVSRPRTRGHRVSARGRRRYL